MKEDFIKKCKEWIRALTCDTGIYFGEKKIENTNTINLEQETYLMYCECINWNETICTMIFNSPSKTAIMLRGEIMKIGLVQLSITKMNSKNVNG